MLQSLHPFVMILLSLFPLVFLSSTCLLFFDSTPLCIPTSLYLCLLLCLFFPHVWFGFPAEDDLSGHSYYPFGRVGIITMEWFTHLHAYRHGNRNIHTNQKYNPTHPHPHSHPLPWTPTHTHTYSERKSNTTHRRGGRISNESASETVGCYLH